jgi:hypothetical protein
MPPLPSDLRATRNAIDTAAIMLILAMEIYKHFRHIVDRMDNRA